MAVTTKTAQDVSTAVKRQFGDEASVQISGSDLIRWINQGQVEIVNRNPILKRVATTDLMSGVFTYTLSGLAILNIQSLQLKGVTLKHYTFQDAEQHIVASDPERVLTGRPTMWYEWAGTLYVYPTPAEDYDGGLSIFYTGAPIDVTAVGDDLSVPDTYFNSLVNYVLSQAYELDENWEGSAIKSQQFDRSTDRLSEDENQPYSNAYGTLTVLPDDM